MILLRVGLLFLIFLCCGFDTAGQTVSGSKDSLLLKSLSSSVTSNCANDSLKALAIYKWIATNIAYDVELYKANGDYMQLIGKVPQKFSSSFEDWYNHQVAAYVLKSRKGVCAGYSSLYKVMCDYAGLKCRVITGHGHDLDSIGLSTETNHAWNAVKFNDSWHLVDATWGSGSVSSGKVSARYDSYYFNTPPKWFIKDHYPKAESNTLLQHKTSVEAFFSLPFVWAYFNKIGGVRFSPTQGRLAISGNDTLEFRITFKGQALPASLEIDPGGYVNLDKPGHYPNPNTADEGIIAYPAEGSDVVFRYYARLKQPKKLTIHAGGKAILTYSIVPKQETKAKELN